MIRIVGFLMICLLLAPFAQAQEDLPDGMIPLHEIGNPQWMAIAPDGAKIAWSSPADGICIYTIDAAENICTPWVEGAPVDVLLVWSDDSRYLTFTENTVITLQESDLWLFDVEAHTFLNRTDDGVQRQFFDLYGEENPFWLDYLPTWAGDTLYFFRLTRRGPISEDYDLSLQRLTADQLLDTSAAPEMVADLAEIAPLPYDVFELTTFSLAGAAAVSPDGSQMAVLVRPRDDLAASAVYLIDLATGEVRPLADLTALNAVGLADWQDGTLLLEGVGWAGDQVVVSLVNQSPVKMVAWNTYTIDPATSAITPVRDYTDLPNGASMVVLADAEKITPEFDQPRASVISPDGTQLIYFNRQRDNQMGLSSLPLPADPDAVPTRIFRLRNEPIFPMQHPSIGDTGTHLRVLVSGYMFELAK